MNQNPFSRHIFPWRLFFVAILIALLLACDAKPRRFRIDILSNNPDFEEIVKGFKHEMSALGYVEGRDVSYNLRDHNASFEAIQVAEREILASNDVDLVLALFTEAALVAKEATRDSGIPVVFAYAGIEGSHLVHSIPEPGGAHHRRSFSRSRANQQTS